MTRLGFFVLFALFVLFSSAALAAPPDPPDPDSVTDPDATTSPAPTDPPPVVRQVGEVIATTTRGERNNLDTPGNITVLDREAIEKSGARDVPDLLRREAGVFVTQDSTNPEGYRLELRGFNNGSGNGSGTLVLVDGRRANEPDSMTTDWALVSIDNVERIEVARGPVNAAWGDAAEAGVINIVTRSGEGPLRFESRGRLASYDTYQGTIFAGGSAGPVTASLFLDGQHSDGYRERSDYRKHGGVFKLGFDIAELARLDVKAGYWSDKRERPGTLSAMQMDFLGRRAAEPGPDDNFNRVRTYNVDGTLQVFLAEEVTFKTTAWYRQRRSKGTLSNPTFVLDDDNETQVVGVNSQLEVRRPIFGHANQLVLGGDWSHDKASFDSVFDDRSPFDFDTITKTRADRTLYGFFLQDDLNLLENLILSGGVRYDRNSRSATNRVTGNDFNVHESAWSPRAALTWRPLELLSVYGSWARGFRFPNLAEAFGFFGFAPELEPEKSTTYEVGAKLRSKYADANVAVYYMTVRNEMLFNTELSPPFGLEVNMDRVRHRGVEFSTTLRPVEWLEFYGSYTYDDVEITRDRLTMLEDNRVPLVPKHRGTAGARVFGPCNTEAGVNANIVGSRLFINDSANAFDQMDAFQVVDGHVAWRPQIGEHVRLGVEFNVYNMLDKQYEEVGGIRTLFDPVTFLPMGQKRFFPSPERNYEVRFLVEVRH